MILSKIIEEKERIVEARKDKVPLSELKAKLDQPGIKATTSFKKAISGEGINLIAEVKRKSPSKGLIRKEFNPIEIALDYAAAGAQALSVLTDEKFFGGSLSFIHDIKKEVGNLPILLKDFVIDEYQIFEGRLAGADAILLIADILTQKQMGNFYNIAMSLGMSALCEVHTEEDLEKALGINADIIGINNRNLRDFKVDLDTTPRIVKNIPQGKIVVAESGIKTNKDVMYLKSLGVQAVLIGETFMKAQDIVAKVREVMGYH